MKDILDKDALDKLLRKNWTSFIHKNRLIAFVLQTARDADLPEAEGVTSAPSHGVKITVSQTDLQSDGLLMWVDFDIPTTLNRRSVGTCEVVLSLNGVPRLVNIVGQTVKII